MVGRPRRARSASETIVHANGEKARQYHNVYGNVWSSIIYDLYKDEYPDTRLMTLMRGGTTACSVTAYSHGRPMCHAHGQACSPQIKIMLNSGLSGLAYMSHDVGGFAIDKENPIDPELYVRWLQLGTFSPFSAPTPRNLPSLTTIPNMPMSCSTW